MISLTKLQQVIESWFQQKQIKNEVLENWEELFKFNQLLRIIVAAKVDEDQQMERSTASNMQTQGQRTQSTAVVKVSSTHPISRFFLENLPQAYLFISFNQFLYLD